MITRASAVFLCFILLGGLAASAQAQLRDPGSSIRRDGAGFGFLLDANYLSPRGCDNIARFSLGAPRGARVYHNAVPYSVVVDTSQRGCGRKGPRVLRTLRPITPGIVPGDVQLFFVSTSGRILKKELIAVQP